MGRASQERRKRRDTTGPDSRTGRSTWMYVAAGVAVVAIAMLAAKFLVRTQVDWKDGSPAWSPDGKRIAFYSERDGNSEIYVMSAEGGAATRLTNSKADEGYPAWSPDGRTISFDSDRDGNFDVFAMDVNGSNVRPLSGHPRARRLGQLVPRRAARSFMSDRDGGFDVRGRAGCGRARHARHAHRDDVVPGVLTRWKNAGVPCRPRRAHHAGIRWRVAPPHHRSRQRHVPVVVAGRQTDRVHELEERQDRAVHDERGRIGSEDAGVDGSRRRGRSALVAGWIEDRLRAHARRHERERRSSAR